MKVCRLLLVALLPVVACGQDEETITPETVQLGRPVDFARDIQPILKANCVACHNSIKHENDLLLETHAQLIKGGDSGSTLTAGKPDESLLYQVAARSEEPVMPPLPNEVNAKAFSPKQLGLLRQWIVEGAKPSAAVAAKKMTWSPVHPRLKAIYAVALDPHSRYAAAGRANRISVYDLQSRKHITEIVDAKLKGAAHRDLVQSLAFHPSGDMIASGGYRAVKLWVRKLVPPSRLEVAGKPIAVAAGGIGEYAIATDDGTLRVIKAGKQVAEWEAVSETAHAAPVKHIAFSGDHVLTASESEVIAWRVSSKVMLSKVEAKAASLLAIATSKPFRAAYVSEDGFHSWRSDDEKFEKATNDVVAGFKNLTCIQTVGTKPQVLVGWQNGSVNLIDLNSKKSVRAFKLAKVKSIAVAEDGKHVAAIGETGFGRVWQMANGKVVGQLNVDVKQSRSLANAGRKRAISERRTRYRDGVMKAAAKEVATQKAALKTAQDGVVKSTKTQKDAAKKHVDETAKVADAKKKADADPKSEPAKKLAANLTKNLARLQTALDAADKALVAAKKNVSITQQSLTRATAESEKQKKLHATEAATLKKLAEAVAKVKAIKPAFAAGVDVVFADSATIATTHANNDVRVWSLAGKPIEKLSIPGVAQAVDATSTGFVGLGERDISVQSIDFTWPHVATIGDEDGASPIADRVLALSFSPDGSKLALGSGVPSRSGQLQVWDVGKKKLLHDLQNAHSDTVLDVEFSRSGARLLSAGADKFARLFNVRTGKVIRSFEGHTHHVIGVDWQPDETRIATAGGDNVIKVWDVDTGEQKRTIKNYRKQVTSLQYIGIGDTILSCSGDRTVRTHTATNGRNVRTFGGATDYMYAVAGSADESLVIAGGEDGVLRVWNGKDGKSLSTFQPLTKQKP